MLLEELTLTELRKIARKYNENVKIPRYTKLTKEELIIALNKHIKLEENIIKFIERNDIDIKYILPPKKVKKNTVKKVKKEVKKKVENKKKEEVKELEISIKPKKETKINIVEENEIEQAKKEIKKLKKELKKIEELQDLEEEVPMFIRTKENKHLWKQEEEKALTELEKERRRIKKELERLYDIEGEELVVVQTRKK
jgi:hypothetical protein